MPLDVLDTRGWSDSIPMSSVIDVAFHRDLCGNMDEVRGVGEAEFAEVSSACFFFGTEKQVVVGVWTLACLVQVISVKRRWTSRKEVLHCRSYSLMH